MPILNVVTDVVGNVGNAPSFIYINTSDTVATVTAAGYLNTEKGLGYSFSNLQLAVVNTTDAGVDLFNVSVAPGTGIITLIANVNPGNVLLPVLVNHLAVFTNVAGQIGDPAGTAIHGGSIQAGLSGTAGSLISFPAAAANGSLSIFATANGAVRNVTITNAAMGQTTAFTIPDPSSATAKFLVNNFSGVQHILTGGLEADNGGFLAGSNGVAGAFTSFPAGAGSGTLIVQASNSGGAFNALLTNASLAQSVIFTMPDPGVAAASFLLTQSAGTQTIATGNLTLTAGNLNLTAGSVNAPLGTVQAGTLQAGSNGVAGGVESYPATMNAGILFLTAVSNTSGNFNATISNIATLAQTTAYGLADPANANARILVGATTTPFTANHSLVASGTGGLIADAGYQMKTVAQAAVAGGAAAQTVNDAFCTSASCVVACWNDTSNAVTIQKVASGNGSFVVTSSGDPGASHISYIITKV